MTDSKNVFIRKTTACILLISIAIVIFGFSACKKEQNNTKNLIYGENEKLTAFDPAPDFSLPMSMYENGELIKGRERKLSTFKGKHILLNFWASWCAPCIKEIPDLLSLQKKFDSELIVLFVNCDSESGIPDAIKIIKEQGMKDSVFFDPELTTLEKYFITGFPETFFISATGALLPVYDPETKKDQLRIMSTREWLSEEFKKSITEVLKK